MTNLNKNCLNKVLLILIIIGIISAFPFLIIILIVLHFKLKIDLIKLLNIGEILSCFGVKAYKEGLKEINETDNSKIQKKTEYDILYEKKRKELELAIEKKKEERLENSYNKNLDKLFGKNIEEKKEKTNINNNSSFATGKSIWDSYESVLDKFDKK